MLKTILIKGITWYRIFIASSLGVQCRFYPTCSVYTSKAIEKYGAKKGLWRGMRRILRCNPWHEGGIDEP